MAENTDTTEDRYAGLEPETIYAMKLVEDQMRQEEEAMMAQSYRASAQIAGTEPPIAPAPVAAQAPITPPRRISFDEAMSFAPGTTADLSRGPGEPSVISPPSPSRLIRLPQATPDPNLEVFETARRFGVPVDAAIKAQQAQRSYDAQRQVQSAIASGMSPEKAFALHAGALFPNLRTLPANMFRAATAAKPDARVVGDTLFALNPATGEWEVKGRGRVGQQRDYAMERQIDALSREIAAGDRQVARLDAQDASGKSSAPIQTALITKRTRLNALIKQYQDFQAGVSTASTPAPAASPAAAPVVAPPSTRTGTAIAKVRANGKPAEAGYRIGGRYPTGSGDKVKVMIYLGGPIGDINNWEPE